MTNSVFISYNHKNREIALRLRESLRENGIQVIIDSEKMQVGEDIKEFIEKCVRESTITLSLVSRESLLSAWVAMETVNTFYHQKTGDKKFIPCYIDGSFFSRGFTDEVLDFLDGEIALLQESIKKRMEKNRNFRDLQDELTRLKDLAHHIDEIIQRLRNSLCVDISGDNYDKGILKIIESIRSK